MGILDSVDDKRHFRVAEEQAFVLCSGERLYSLEDLVTAINLCEPEVFHTHVNDGKNDFAAWIEGVFGESGLAQQMREHATPLRMVISIERYLRPKQEIPAAPAPEQ